MLRREEADLDAASRPHRLYDLQVVTSTHQNFHENVVTSRNHGQYVAIHCCSRRWFL